MVGTTDTFPITSYKRIQIPIEAVPSKIRGIGKVYVLFWGVFCREEVIVGF